MQCPVNMTSRQKHEGRGTMVEKNSDWKASQTEGPKFPPKCSPDTRARERGRPAGDEPPGILGPGIGDKHSQSKEGPLQRASVPRALTSQADTTQHRPSGPRGRRHWIEDRALRGSWRLERGLRPVTSDGRATGGSDQRSSSRDRTETRGSANPRRSCHTLKCARSYPK